MALGGGADLAIDHARGCPRIGSLDNLLQSDVWHNQTS
jgi:hypothetical protein